jgi:hypothetical protein
MQCSPFKALYAADPHPRLFPTLQLTDHPDVAELLKERQMSTALLKEQLAKAQNRMKLQADNNRIDRSFQIGEMGLLKLQPYVQSSVVQRPCPKLAFKYYGPYEIIHKISLVAYKLQLPSDSRIHPVFHVSQLRQFTPDHFPVFAKLPKPPSLDIAEVSPESILDHRLVKRANEAITQVLIQWSGLPRSSATWEGYYVLRDRSPTAAAWGQTDPSGAGNVTPK